MASKSKKSTHRKLTAILCADVAGYSRLMGADEEATIETLTACRKVFLSLIESHRGRVVDAVNGAVAIQQELAAHTADLAVDGRMHFRIGINLGDVVFKDDATYGDGVNVAARLEAPVQCLPPCGSNSWNGAFLSGTRGAAKPWTRQKLASHSYAIASACGGCPCCEAGPGVRSHLIPMQQAEWSQAIGTAQSAQERFP